jgi:hypothetical protein
MGRRPAPLPPGGGGAGVRGKKRTSDGRFRALGDAARRSRRQRVLGADAPDVRQLTASRRTSAYTEHQCRLLR